MNIRLADYSDLPRLHELYDGARRFMRAHGNSVQWVNGYPDERQLRADIAGGHLYSVEHMRQIVGVFYFAEEEEPTYNHIEQGPGWPDALPYGVVHRMAGSASVRGLARFCFRHCLSRCSRLRVDTHASNYPMLRLLEQMGFTYCGIIYVQDGTPRKAFCITKEEFARQNR